MVSQNDAIFFIVRNYEKFMHVCALRIFKFNDCEYYLFCNSKLSFSRSISALSCSSVGK